MKYINKRRTFVYSWQNTNELAKINICYDDNHLEFMTDVSQIQDHWYIVVAVKHGAVRYRTIYEQITNCSAKCHRYCINRSKRRRSAIGVSKQRSYKIFLIELERLELSYDLNLNSQYCSLISFSCVIIQPFIWQCQINLLTLLISGCYP